jgi:hypothetical protein
MPDRAAPRRAIGMQLHAPSHHPLIHNIIGLILARRADVVDVRRLRAPAPAGRGLLDDEVVEDAPEREVQRVVARAERRRHVAQDVRQARLARRLQHRIIVAEQLHREQHLDTRERGACT